LREGLRRDEAPVGSTEDNMVGFALQRRGLKASVAMGALVLALSACAPNPTPYVPAASNKGYGYSEQQIESNRWRVTFTGNVDTPRQMVENGLLYRAAQLTKTSGYDYFVEVTKETEPTTRYRSTITDYGYGGFGHFGRHWGGGFDTAYSDTYPVTNYAAYADIVMMKGRKDANDPKAYNADDVLAKLGPVIYYGKAALPPGGHY
jgi:hypothetical protein